MAKTKNFAKSDHAFLCTFLIIGSLTGCYHSVVWSWNVTETKLGGFFALVAAAIAWILCTFIGFTILSFLLEAEPKDQKTKELKNE